MTQIVPNASIITCPVCGSDGDALRHDLRCSLLYVCERCEHEWQIAPGEEPPEASSEGPETAAQARHSRD